MRGGQHHHAPYPSGQVQDHRGGRDRVGEQRPYPNHRSGNEGYSQENRRRGHSRSRSRERVRDYGERENMSHFQDNRTFHGSAEHGRHGYDRDYASRGGGKGSRRDDNYGDGGYAASSNWHDGSSSWNRDRDRNRDWNRDRDQDRDREWSRSNDRGWERDRRSHISEPTNTVIIKGLPTHTTEPSLYTVLANFSPQKIRLISERGSSECKGYAFVEFFSTEYAENFTKFFSGSLGDQNGPQLIVDGRAVMMDFATPRSELDHSSSSGKYSSSDSHKRSDRESSSKGDWLCETCECQNFARRDKCYRCSAMRTSTAVRVTANLAVDPFGDVNIVSSTPSSTLAVRGLPLFSNEEQISEMFRQYAMVKSVHVLRDPQSNMSRGIAFVEFPSVDHATHTLNLYNQNQQKPSSSTQPLKVSYAKQSFVQGLPSLQQQQLQMHHHMAVPTQYSASVNPSQAPATSTSAHGAGSLDVQKAYARAALEAAQWSAGGASSGTQDPPPSNVQAKQPPVAPSYTTPSYFETHGASYTFQPKTGIFYDSLTKFYYCPKSKLYYSEVDGRYLYAVSCDKQSGKHTPAAPAGLDFLEFIPPNPASMPEESTARTEGEATDQLPVARQPVTMSLGFGAKKNGPKAKLATSTITNVGLSTVAIPAVLPATAKQMSQDIAKWSERKSSAEEAKEEHVSVQKKGDNVSTSAVAAAPIPAFVCTLCRRQFTSGEQLLRHERESKLHAANLAKAGQATKTAELDSSNVSTSASGAGTATAYRDRASERRAVHGQIEPDNELLVPSKTDWLCNKCKCENFARRVSCYRCSAPISIANGGPVIPNERSRHMDYESRSDSTQVSVKNSLNEDLENPGNQMLRRLGWKDGEGLGRGGAGDVETVAAKIEHRSGGSSAVKSGVGVSSSAIPAIDYGARERSAHSGETKGEYKNSIMRAAKARFDMIDSQKK